MRHPDEQQIALYAGSDANWMEQIRIRHHLGQCRACRERVDAYRRDREVIRQEAQALPPGLNWDRLAREMTANIRVGLAAGECVSGVHRARHRIGWRPALAGAGLMAIFVSGWYLNFPAEQRASLGRGIARLFTPPARGSAPVAGVSLEATRNGVQISENGSALTMMHPATTTQAVVVVNTKGSLRARYIDDDTGQVTVTNVYAQ